VLLSGTDTAHSPQYATTLYRSTDNGVSWSEVLPIVDGHVARGCWAGYYCDDTWRIDVMVWNQVEGEGSVILAGGHLRIFAQPIQKDTCGLWRSVDGGKNWSLVLPLGRVGQAACFLGSFRQEAITSIAISPKGDALLVVWYCNLDSSFSCQQTGSQLYKSSDGGETWELADTPDGSEALGVVYLGNHLKSD
jgi:hypothetical protein